MAGISVYDTRFRLSTAADSACAMIAVRTAAEQTPSTAYLGGILLRESTAAERTDFAVVLPDDFIFIYCCHAFPLHADYRFFPAMFQHRAGQFSISVLCPIKARASPCSPNFAFETPPAAASSWQERDTRP